MKSNMELFAYVSFSFIVGILIGLCYPGKIEKQAFAEGDCLREMGSSKVRKVTIVSNNYIETVDRSGYYEKHNKDLYHLNDNLNSQTLVKTECPNE
jgi:hypothetical protein